MVEKIAACAKKIETFLMEQGEINVLLLPECLNERGLVTYQALGWLANQGHIHYIHRLHQVYVSLEKIMWPPAAEHPKAGGQSPA